MTTYWDHWDSDFDTADKHCPILEAQTIGVVVAEAVDWNTASTKHEKQQRYLCVINPSRIG